MRRHMNWHAGRSSFPVHAAFRTSYRGIPVQRKKAVELQEAWRDKPCSHPAFSREYDQGERTGNYCCTQCGASMTFRQKSEIMAARAAEARR